MKNILVIALISILLLACSSATTMTLREKDIAYSKYVIDEELPSKDRVEGFRYNDWKSLSDNYLILTAVHKENYLIQTRGTCFDLNNARGIKLNRTSNLSINVLGDSISLVSTGDPIGVGGSGSSTGRVTGECFIKSIYPITNAQTDSLVGIGKQVQYKS